MTKEQRKKLAEMAQYPIDIHGNIIKDWKTTVGVTYWPGYGNVSRETPDNKELTSVTNRFTVVNR